MYFFVYTPSKQHFKAFLDHTWIHCTQRAQANTLPSVLTSSQCYIPSGQFPVSNCNFNATWTTCARILRYTRFTIMQLDTH